MVPLIVIFLHLCPLIIYFDRKAVFHYSHFLRSLLNYLLSMIVLNFPQLISLCASFQHLIKMLSYDNIFLRYHCHFSKGKPTLNHEDTLHI
ncbi:hypothetical protein NC652_039410 [Populus alba x Populus x berolinensis]|nr:hypothetical protein NC652_039410 [Populus alba x Populus x berolinensis]